MPFPHQQTKFNRTGQFFLREGGSVEKAPQQKRQRVLWAFKRQIGVHQGQGGSGGEAARAQEKNKQKERGESWGVAPAPQETGGKRQWRSTEKSASDSRV